MDKRIKKIGTWATICSLIFITKGALPSNEQKFEFIVAKDIVTGVRKKFKSFNSYQANFKMTMQKGGRKNHRSGTIYFRKPDKVHMKFSYPYNQVVISDGEKVWIYLPKLRLLGKQDLKSRPNDGFFSKVTPVGLDRLFSLYHYSFEKGEQPRKATDAKGETGESFYILNLRQKVITSGFRKMVIWVDTRYFIRKVTAESALGKKITIEFSNIETNKFFDDTLFTFNKKKYKIKSIIRNPLVQP